jgi:hypothetical protein
MRSLTAEGSKRRRESPLRKQGRLRTLAHVLPQAKAILFTAVVFAIRCLQEALTAFTQAGPTCES